MSFFLFSDISMNYLKYDIVFQEIPGEISLALYITGCPLHCRGCHSPQLWNAKNGQWLNDDFFVELLNRYKGRISTVLFMGGEWEPQTLVELILIAKTHGLKVALYTGHEWHELSQEIVFHLNFLKTGRWIEKLGGLDSPTTNQKLYTF